MQVLVIYVICVINNQANEDRHIYYCLKLKNNMHVCWYLYLISEITCLSCNSNP